MINRTTVRTKVIQTLFAYYKTGDKTPLTAKKELLNSFEDTYDLYVLLLDFVNELTAYAESQIEQAEAKAKVLHQRTESNRRFVNNRLAQQIFSNHAIRSHRDNNKLCWDAGMSAVSAVYKQLTESDFYREYMESEEDSYQADKRIWRKIFTELMTDNDTLASALEDMELTLDHANWTTDMDLAIGFVVKTIKRFEEENGSEQEILPMFDSEQELDFGKDLLRHALEGKDEYDELIHAHLKNWDADRIMYMDRIILQTALAEIIHFPDIALEVSMNEYIELSKYYSSDKSYTFINGILNEILRDMKRENKLIKAMLLR